MGQRAIFLDRDGTLVHSYHYPSRPEHLRLYDNIGPGLCALQDMGFRMVIITNQAGIARGYFTHAELAILHEYLTGALAQLGVHVDGIYHCPHHPEGTVPEFAFRCDCRKPQPGMLLKAAEDLDIDLGRSWFVGDILDDVEAGNRAGCRTVLVDLGTESMPEQAIRYPTFIARNTLHALEMIKIIETSTADLTYCPAKWRSKPLSLIWNVTQEGSEVGDGGLVKGATDDHRRNVIMYEQGRSLRVGTSFSASASTSAIELVRQFRRLRALVIGDAMLDTYLEGTAARLCSEGPVPVVQKTAEYRIPGGAANTAANLRALDADVLLLARIGRDTAGSVLRAALRERGISDRWLVEDDSVSTLHKLRVLADGQYVVRFDEGGDHDPSLAPQAPCSQPQLLEHLEEAYASSDLVVVSDYRYGVVSAALLERLQQLYTAHPKVLVIDSKELQRFSQLRATVVTPNYLEACLLVGQTVTHRTLDLREVELVGQRLLAMLKTEHIAITIAEHGVLLLNRQGKSTHLPAHPVAQANDVGAGDSFASAMALALAAGGSMEEAVQIGIDAASVAVTKRWTAVVQHQELLQRVSVREHVRALSVSASGAIVHMLAAVIAQVEAERLQRRRIIFTNGVFDILHAGHVQFLRQAKALGDVLIVGINSDSSTRRLKGNGRPINSERDRLALVAALDVVDHVLLFDEDTPTALIRLLRPDIHVKGGDYADEALPEAEAVREGGGHVVILPLAGSISTTSMIDRILALTTENEASVAEKRNV